MQSTMNCLWRFRLWNLGGLLLIAVAAAGPVRAADDPILAGAWESPTLTLAHQNAPVESFARDQEGMSMVALRLAQTIPFIGKTSRRSDLARRVVDAARCGTRRCTASRSSSWVDSRECRRTAGEALAWTVFIVT